MTDNPQTTDPQTSDWPTAYHCYLCNGLIKMGSVCPCQIELNTKVSKTVKLLDGASTIEMTKAEPLKCCPFCGERPKMLGGGLSQDTPSIHCGGCYVHMDRRNERILIEDWNARI